MRMLSLVWIVLAILALLALVGGPAASVGVKGGGVMHLACSGGSGSGGGCTT